MPDTYLITGAAGFIGSHLARALLKRGDRVIGVDNFDPFYERAIKLINIADFPPDRFHLVEADVRDRPAMTDVCRREKPVAIVHLAAKAGVRPSVADPAGYVSVNIDGTVSMLEAARMCGNLAFILASSSSVYGDAAAVPFREEDPAAQPLSPYAATKRGAELLASTYASMYGMRIGALRFFTVYGPGQRPDLAIQKFMRLLASDEAIPMFGDGATSRDYTYIDDIVRGVLATIDRVSLQSPPFYRVWNLGGSSPIELWALIDLIGQVAGRTPRVERQPMQPGDVHRTYADLTRSRAELGFEPGVLMEEGLWRQWDATERTASGRS